MKFIYIEMDKIVCVVQMRLGSTRLPNKGMLKINNKSLLDILVNRLKKCKNLDDIFIATSNSNKNIPIIDYCKKNNINYVTGSEENVYSRFKLIYEKFNYNNLIRITGDNPLIDYEYLDYYINIYKNTNYDYLCNIGTPIGSTWFEFINMEKLISYEKNIDDYTNFTSIMKNDKNKLFNKKIDILKIDHALTRKDDLLMYIRLTIDVIQDFEFIKKILENFKDKEYEIKLIDILDFLKNNKHLIDININCEKYHYYDFLELYKINKV